MVKKWKLIGADGQKYESDTPGTLGGHRRSRIYGRFSCRVALRAIAVGGYVTNRVFFKDEATAVAAGYRPCAVCMPKEYAVWKARQNKADKEDVKDDQASK
jgi:methylphosphotriester-DNA--protein-cysteine methyltransferase